ncbi:hypothetical protein C8F01DRAFT_271638 [Mycena amicta]|nr:hypothetical protein C8F01DRAFT_271638 [Mycena amicta]
MDPAADEDPADWHSVSSRYYDLPHEPPRFLHGPDTPSVLDVEIQVAHSDARPSVDSGYAIEGLNPSEGDSDVAQGHPSHVFNTHHDAFRQYSNAGCVYLFDTGIYGSDSEVADTSTQHPQAGTYGIEMDDGNTLASTRLFSARLVLLDMLTKRRASRWPLVLPRPGPDKRPRRLLPKPSQRWSRRPSVDRRPVRLFKWNASECSDVQRLWGWNWSPEPRSTYFSIRCRGPLDSDALEPSSRCPSSSQHPVDFCAGCMPKPWRVSQLRTRGYWHWEVATRCCERHDGLPCLRTI